MAEVDNNNHRHGGRENLPCGGGNGHGVLDRPIIELTDAELSAAREELSDRLKLRAEIGEEAAAASEKFRRIIEEIESLSENEFELRCKDIAKKYGVSAALLRKWWRQLHQVAGESRPGGGKRLELPVDDPWPQAVSTSDLLSTIMAKLQEHVVLESGAALAVALYTMLTYVVDALQLCPMLMLRSATKRSGKTTLLGLLLRMTCRALGVASISAAALYRVVDSLKPTLLLDEVDATLAQKTDTAEALRGLLNAGNDRTSSRVLRCVGEDKEVVSYDCFGAKVLAGIGHIPDTMEDRAIVVELRRKLHSEKVRRFSVLDDQSEFKEIRRKLVRWAADHRRLLGVARPHLPSGLNDRASDNWSPLLAIADLAGGEWSIRARTAAIWISGRVRDEEQDVRFELLKDIRSVFEEEGGAACKALATSALVEKLSQRDESPWGTFNRGQPVNPRVLGRMLKPFGIASVNLKIGRDSATGKEFVAKGYKREAFVDAWTRYLPQPLLEEKINDIGTGEGSDGATDGVSLGSSRVSEVADKCRYRYPVATGERAENASISEEKPP